MDKYRENPALLAEDDGTRLVESAGVAATQQVSNRTNVHDAGSDANDTPDGLTESEEAVRHAAEDMPIEENLKNKADAVPVFDRASLPPKT